MATSKSPVETAASQSKVRRTGSTADKLGEMQPDAAGVALLLGDIVSAGSGSMGEKKIDVDSDLCDAVSDLVHSGFSLVSGPVSADSDPDAAVTDHDSDDSSYEWPEKMTWEMRHASGVEIDSPPTPKTSLSHPSCHPSPVSKGRLTSA